MRSFVTPRAFAVERVVGYGVSILTFFTDPRYAAIDGLVNSPRPRGQQTPRPDPDSPRTMNSWTLTRTLPGHQLAG